MKYRNTTVLIGMALLLCLAGSVIAATPEQETALQAQEKELHAQLEAEYAKAIAVAEQERLSAEASIAKARKQLSQVSEQQRDIARAQAEENAEVRAVQQAKMEKMHEELNQARRQLKETQREIARVNHDVARARAEEHHSTRLSYRISGRPVIGIILGNADDVGVEVLGVSPDGPSERAGIKQGDVIIAVGGQVLAAIDESDNASDGLRIAMRDVMADEPLNITIERADKIIDLTVMPKVREPLTWHTVTRFPSVPHAPTHPVNHSEPSKLITVERMVVPQINTDGIAEQIEKIRIEVDERRILIDKGAYAPFDGDYEFEFHDLSEMGNYALLDANVWFGLPMTRGLELAEMNKDLGEYFKTDRGVLVLKAKTDNKLQLQPGDVILSVGDTEVNSPAEFMRALRGFASGVELEIDIKRKRKDRTLKTVMPENRTSFFSSNGDDTRIFSTVDEETHIINITSH